MLVHLALVAFAVVGVASTVAYAIGLVQRTPVHSERALQDAGWTRRPIRLTDAAAIELAKPRLKRPIPQGGKAAQDNAYDDDVDVDVIESDGRNQLVDPDVTIHNFNPKGSFTTSTSDTPASLQHHQQDPDALYLPSNELHLLVLCPVRNAATDLVHLFDLLDSMKHPQANTSLGFLVGDEDDNTGDVLHDLVEQRMNDARRRYRHVTLLHKDFKVEMPSGSARHAYLLQTQRR